jgi:hypothetical protein
LWVDLGRNGDYLKFYYLGREKAEYSKLKQPTTKISYPFPVTSPYVFSYM